MAAVDADVHFVGTPTTLTGNNAARGGALFTDGSATALGLDTLAAVDNNLARLHGDDVASSPSSLAFQTGPVLTTVMPGNPVCPDGGCVMLVTDAYAQKIGEPVVVAVSVNDAPGISLIGPSFVLVSGGLSEPIFDFAVGVDSDAVFNSNGFLGTEIIIRVEGAPSEPAATASVTLSQCLPGFGLGPSGIACVPCADGTHSAVASMATCEACLDGLATTGLGAVSCDACQAGYGDDGSGTACAPCDAGYYSSNSSRLGAACLECQPGLGTDGEGATACLVPTFATGVDISASTASIVVTVLCVVIFGAATVASLCCHSKGRHGVIATAGLSSYDVITDGARGRQGEMG